MNIVFCFGPRLRLKFRPKLNNIKEQVEDINSMFKGKRYFPVFIGKNIPTDVDWSSQMVGVMIGAALMRILFSVFLMFGTILDASLITDCSSSFLSIELGILTSISSSVETSLVPF